MFKNVLIVCHANICRSPMAEGMFLADPSIQAKGIKVSSAGLAAVDGHAADETVVELMAAKGVDIKGHRAKRISLEMIRAAQLILVMEDRQIGGVHAVDLSSKGKVHLLGKWGNFEIYDPYKQDGTVYVGSADLIERSVSLWVKKIC